MKLPTNITSLSQQPVKVMPLLTTEAIVVNLNGHRQNKLAFMACMHACIVRDSFPVTDKVVLILCSPGCNNKAVLELVRTGVGIREVLIQSEAKISSKFSMTEAA